MRRSSFVVLTVAVLCLGATQAKAAWTTFQLTDNNADDVDPAISGSNVVWSQWDGSDWEIYSNFAEQLTDNDIDDRNPDISGTNVVWERQRGGSIYERGIYSNFAGWLSNSYHDERHPAISGTNVVWQSLHSIYSNFAGRLSANGNYNAEKSSPAISGTNVVWADDLGRYSPTVINSNFAGHLSDGTASPHSTHSTGISGTNVVWSEEEYGRYRIQSNFAGIIDEGRNGIEMGYPAISGTNVVWGYYDGFDLEIHTNFGGPVTDDDFFHWSPDISGTTVVWSRGLGDRSEIFMGTWAPDEIPSPPGTLAVIPAPGALLLGSIGAGVVSWLRRRRTL